MSQKNMFMINGLERQHGTSKSLKLRVKNEFINGKIVLLRFKTSFISASKDDANEKVLSFYVVLVLW